MDYKTATFPSNLVASGLMSEFPEFKPEGSTQPGIDGTLGTLHIPSGVDSSFKTASGNSLIIPEVHYYFELIKTKYCQYGQFVLSVDLSHFYSQKCGVFPDWTALRNTIIYSLPGFTVSSLEGGSILSIVNLFKEESEENALTINRKSAAWSNALKSVFRGQDVISEKVVDAESLQAIHTKYYPSDW